MKRWNTIFDVVQEPLIALMAAIIFRGMSSFILSANLAKIIVLPTIVYIIAELLRYFGSFIVINFPFLVMIRALSKRYEGSFPAFTGVIAYIFFHIVTMFVTSTSMPSMVYYDVLGIHLDVSRLHTLGDIVRYPIQTGLLAALIVWAITRFCYHKSRNRMGYGLLSFIDKDSYCLILSVIGSGIAAVGIATIWPFFISSLYGIFRFIGYDITNPLNSFVYGVVEKILSLTNLPSLIREPFWFGEFGGSWLSTTGVNYLGDVSIWTAQSAQGIFNTGVGRFITPHFIINMFIIPAVACGVYSTITDKMERRKYIIFLIVFVLLSLLFDTSLPVEIFLIVMCPLFYIGHVFAVGLLFALLQILNIQIGYNYSGPSSLGSPGSILDLFINFRNPEIQIDVLLVIAIGVVAAILYFFAIRHYYKKLGLDVMQTGRGKKVVENFIDSVGGVQNIKMINSTPTKVIVQIENRTLIDFNKLQRNGAYKIVETRAGYSVYFGTASAMIRNQVLKQLND